MGWTGIAVYQLVARVLQDVGGLPPDEAAKRLQNQIRVFIEQRLSHLNPSFIEPVKSSALAHLADPDPETLAKAVELLNRESAWGVVEEALQRSADALPQPDLNIHVLVFPADGESRVLTQEMRGVIAASLGSQLLLLIVWPTEGWRSWLAYTVAHEYTHLVYNHLFPRDLSGHRMIYIKSHEPQRLLDAMIEEGIADAFARSLYPGLEAPWTRALTAEVEAAVWPKVRRRLAVENPMEIQLVLMGDNDRFPPWTGWAIGCRIVERYLQAHQDTQPTDLVGLSARSIFEESGYTPGMLGKGR